VPDKIISRHAGGTPRGLKASILIKPLVSRLMVKLMAPRVLRSVRGFVMILGHGVSSYVCILDYPVYVDTLVGCGAKSVPRRQSTRGRAAHIRTVGSPASSSCREASIWTGNGNIVSIQLEKAAAPTLACETGSICPISCISKRRSLRHTRIEKCFGLRREAEIDEYKYRIERPQQRYTHDADFLSETALATLRQIALPGLNRMTSTLVPTNLE
jgi:hypothetical protein